MISFTAPFGRFVDSQQDLNRRLLDCVFLFEGASAIFRKEGGGVQPWEVIEKRAEQDRCIRVFRMCQN